jgi:hypothetical protein
MIPSNKAKVLTVVLLSTIFLATACSIRTADLTLVSTKNIDLSDTRLDAKLGQRQTAKDCVFILLGIIPFGVPNMKTAVDRALEAGKGNIMIDEVTWVENYYFVLGGQSCIKVEGTVLTVPITKNTVISGKAVNKETGLEGQ